MGDRADRYRGMGWPDVINTEYLADPTDVNGYDMINIHYAYTGSNHAVQKSEKDLTLICKRSNDDTTYRASTLGTIAAEIKGMIEAIVNPTDSRYLATPAASSVTDGHFVAFDKTGNVVTVEDSSYSAASFTPA